MCSMPASALISHPLLEEPLITVELSYNNPADSYTRWKKNFQIDTCFFFFLESNNRIPHSCLQHIHSKLVRLLQMLSVTDVGYYTGYYHSPQRPKVLGIVCTCMCAHSHVVFLFRLRIFMLIMNISAICLSGVLSFSTNQAKV